VNKEAKKCALCVEENKLQERTAPRDEFKCINFKTYNKYNQIRSINADHFSLDTKCPSMQEMIVKCKQNTDY